MTTGYSGVAPLYLERGFLPFPTRGKRTLPTGATGRNGSITSEKVQGWMQSGFRYLADPATQQWATQDPATANVALRAGDLEVRIDVDAYGDKMGSEQLDELERRLGPLPATPSSTARGIDSPARQYFFALHEPVTLIHKAAPDIDIIQAHHRYSIVWPSVHPETGALYQWYDAEGAPLDGPPHVSELEYLPEAWVDYLRAVEGGETHSAEQWDGEIPETASPDEERKLRAIVSSLQELPADGSAGQGWHDTVVRAAGWLARIARSNAYALTFEAARELLFQHTPISAAEGGAADLEQQWQSMVRSTEGQFEPAPAPPIRPLLPWAGFPTSVRYPEIQGQPFALVWAHVPPFERAAEHRRALMDSLVAAQVNPTEIATLVWYCGAAQAAPITFGGVQVRNADARAMTLDELWAEVDAAVVRHHAPAEQAPAQPAAADMPLVVPVAVDAPRLSFLSDGERSLVESYAWWGARFLRWAQETFSSVNMPYYRMNRWTVLSVIFASKGVLPRPGGNDRPLNLYMCIVGRTTSGKSEALRAVKHIIRLFYIMDESPDIGGNHTNESLPRVLIERSGQSTWFRLDEAHTKIPTWKKMNSYAGELPGILTDVYDGEVGPRFRNTDKDNDGKGGEASLTVHLMGTPNGMADVMGPDDWESGFLNRFVWGIGDPPIDTIESIAGDWIDEDELEEDTEAVRSGHEMYQQWGAEFSNALVRVERPDRRPQRMKLPKEVIDRHRRFVQDLQKLGSKGPYVDRLRPTFKRLNETVLRAAALVALSDGRTRVDIKDMLVAIEQAEEWAANILTMVAATDESIRTRMVNKLEIALLEHGGVMPIQQIHRLPRFKDQSRETMGLIDELISQGRAQWMEPTKQTLIAKGVTNA